MSVSGLIDAAANRIYYRPTRSNGSNKTDSKRELQRASRLLRWAVAGAATAAAAAVTTASSSLSVRRVPSPVVLAISYYFVERTAHTIELPCATSPTILFIGFSHAERRIRLLGASDRNGACYLPFWWLRSAAECNSITQKSDKETCIIKLLGFAFSMIFVVVVRSRVLTNECMTRPISPIRSFKKKSKCRVAHDWHLNEHWI